MQKNEEKITKNPNAKGEDFDFGCNHSTINTPVGKARLNIESFDAFDPKSGDVHGNLHPHSIGSVLDYLESENTTHYNICFNFDSSTKAYDFVDILPKSINAKKGHHLDDERDVCIRTRNPKHKSIERVNKNAISKLQKLIEIMKQWEYP